MTLSEATANPQTSSPPRVQNIVRWIAGVILILAAILKGHELFTTPAAEKGILSNRWLLIGLIEFEWILGVLLLSGLMTRVTWATAVVAFGIFTCIAGYMAWIGETSCGCFGKAKVDPRITMAVDAMLFAALLIWRPRGAVPESLRWGLRPALTWALIATVALPAGIGMVVAQNRSRAVDDSLLGSGSFVVMEPAKWLHKRFPLIPYIDIGEQLATGKWLVVIYDHTCSHCQAAMPAYRKVAQALAEQPDGFRVALVQLPPYGRSAGIDGGGRHLEGKLNTSRDWFAQTPVELSVVDGVVHFGKEQGDGLEWFRAESSEELR